MTDADDLPQTLAGKGPQVLKQLRRMVNRLLDRHHLAVELFLDEGKVKPTAARWLQRLADENFVNRSAFHSDPREHAFREGRRALALEIIGSTKLDVEKLRSLTNIEREIP